MKQDVRPVIMKEVSRVLNIPESEVDDKRELGANQFGRIMAGAAERLGCPLSAIKNGLRRGAIGNIIEMLEIVVNGMPTKL